MVQIGIPQLIWLAILVGSIAVTFSRHGQPRKPSTYNGWTSLVGGFVAFGLLYWGGFFG